MDEAFTRLTGFRRVVYRWHHYLRQQHHATHRPCLTVPTTMWEETHHAQHQKWRYAQREVTFAGFIISDEGYKIDPSITDAIAKFPTPSNWTDLRSFFGLVNQLSASTDTIAGLLAPLRPLLSTKNEFLWSTEHDQALLMAKASLTSNPILAFFDSRKPTRLCTNASRQGLGFILQKYEGDNWTLIQVGSRFLSDPES